MINIFSPAGNDQSIAYLAQLFGIVGNVLPVAANTNLIVGMLFKTINTMALTIGALIVVYVTVVGLMQTAQEGEFLGKKWNGLWVPIRTVFGIAALFPTPSGYSAIQIIFMWVIAQGVGAADTLWTTVLQYTDANGGLFPPSNVSTSDINSGMKSGSTLTTLFQSLTCQATYYVTANPPLNTTASAPLSKFNCVGDPLGAGGGTPPPLVAGSSCQQGPVLDIINSSSQVSSTGGNITYSMGPGGACGTLTYTDPAGAVCSYTSQSGMTSCAVAKAQQQALQSIVSTFASIANVFAQTDLQYVQFLASNPTTITTPSWVSQYCLQNTNGTCNAKSLSSTYAAGSNTDVGTSTVQNLYLPYAITPLIGATNFVTSAANMYQAAINQAELQTTMSTSTLSSSTSQLGFNSQEAQQEGWIFAGSYYYFLTQKSSNSSAQISGVTFNVTPGKAGTLRSNLTAASDLLAQITKTTNSYGSGQTGVSNSTSGNAGPSEMAPINDVTNKGAGTLLDTFMKNLNGRSAVGGGSSLATFHTNVLSNIASFGQGLMILAQSFYALILTVLAALAVASTLLSIQAWGFGVPGTPATVMTITTLLMPFFLLLLGSLYTLGATLGIYVPLIPYIVFITGAIGWFLAVIEAMVAAPLVALGILSPGGQHDILGRGEPALMMLFNLFLRPSLMIVGFIISIFLSIVVINLINSGFLVIVKGIMTAPGLFEEILFISAYTSLLITALNKTFSVIYEVPNRVLTWLSGGQAVSHGEGEALGQVQKGVEGAAASTSKGFGDSATGAQSSAKEGDRNKIEYNKDRGSVDKAKSMQGGGMDVSSNKTPPSGNS